MIKAEVVFNGDEILVNDNWWIWIQGNQFLPQNYNYHVSEKFDVLEQAISYCLQQPPK